MRLLITTDTVGGVWSFTRELTRLFLGRGHEVSLVSFGREPSPSQRQWCAEQQHGNDKRFTVRYSTVPLEWMQNNENAFEAGQWELLDEANHFHPDLIVSNQFCFGRLGTPVPRIVIAHSDVLSWARACRPSALEPSPWLSRYTAMVQAGLLDTAAVVAPTAWMGKALKTHFFLPRDVVVIPNGVAVEPNIEVAVEPDTTPQPLRKLQAISAGRLWDKAKGVDILRDLNSAPMPLLLAGDSAFEPPEGQSPWPAHLVDLGPLSQPELHRRFRESAIYLCTSRYEPFGLAPIEAALCGCAVVARDLPSLREVWAEDALYFTDADSLEHVLGSLANDAQLLAFAGERARRRAAHFTPEHMADSYLQLFQSLLPQQATQHVF